MMNVCQNCEEYRADKLIDPSRPFAVCPLCGFCQPFQQLPLLDTTGIPLESTAAQVAGWIKLKIGHYGRNN